MYVGRGIIQNIKLKQGLNTLFKEEREAEDVSNFRWGSKNRQSPSPWAPRVVFLFHSLPL
jgi:hypothetical protein